MDEQQFLKNLAWLMVIAATLVSLTLSLLFVLNGGSELLLDWIIGR
jgi:hypothetical protein